MKTAQYRKKTSCLHNPCQSWLFASLATFVIMALQSQSEELLRADRLQHFFVAFAFCFLYQCFTQKSDALYLFSLITLFGIGKEWMDHDWELFDLVANNIGFVFSLLVFFMVKGLSSLSTPASTSNLTAFSRRQKLRF